MKKFYSNYAEFFLEMGLILADFLRVKCNQN